MNRVLKRKGKKAGRKTARRKEEELDDKAVSAFKTSRPRQAIKRLRLVDFVQSPSHLLDGIAACSCTEARPRASSSVYHTKVAVSSTHC